MTHKNKPNDNAEYTIINPQQFKKDMEQLVTSEQIRLFEDEVNMINKLSIKEANEKDVLEFLNECTLFRDLIGRGRLLAKYDIFHFHSNTVRYKNKIICFLGNSGRGKTTLSNRLANETGAKLLSDDQTLAYHKAGLLYVCKNKGIIKCIIDYTQMIKENKPIDVILHLELGRRKFSEGIPKEAFWDDGTFWLFDNKSLYIKNIKQAQKTFSQIPSYTYTRGLDNNVEKAYHTLKNNLDCVISELEKDKK